MFFPKLSFYISFHSKLLLSHLPTTLVVSMSKLIHTTMLEIFLSNKIDSILLLVGMPFPIQILIIGSIVYSSISRKPPFCNYIFYYCSTINQIENYTYSCNLFFTTRKYFLQLLTSNVEKYKSRVKLQSKVYATCQHHNNSHYLLI